MNIHEYQGKEILRQFGVPVPRGIPAFTVQEAVEAAQKLGGPVWVVPNGSPLTPDVHLATLAAAAKAWGWLRLVTA